MTDEHSTVMRVSDADRNGTLRRLHNAVALGLIDIGEFEERSARVSAARLQSELDVLVGDLPGPGAIVTSVADRVELRGFGAFTVKHRAARQGRNPRTGDTVFVEDKYVPFFKTGKELRERLNPA